MTDESIGYIAKLLQMAILTGTDVVDNLRLLRFEIDGESLIPSSEFVSNFEKNINSILENEQAS